MSSASMPRRKSAASPAAETPVRMITVHVRGNDGQSHAEEQVRAGIFGPIAVHPAIGGDDPGAYVVTHVVTGFNLSGLTLNRAVAIAVAERLAVDPAWNFQTLAEFEQRKPELRKKLDAAIAAGEGRDGR